VRRRAGGTLDLKVVTVFDTIQELRPAERTSRLGFSDIVKIRNRVMAMKEQGARVLQLEGGEPFMPRPDFIKDAM
jgi:aspartate aminotransferase